MKLFLNNYHFAGIYDVLLQSILPGLPFMINIAENTTKYDISKQTSRTSQDSYSGWQAVNVLLTLKNTNLEGLPHPVGLLHLNQDAGNVENCHSDQRTAE
jgi:hypothetical protein